MPRLTRAIRNEQLVLLAAIVRSCPDTTNRQIAQVAGVDQTMVSKWGSDGEDGRELKASEEKRLADCFGWDVVYGDAIRAAGWDLIPRTAVPATNPLQGTVELVGAASRTLTLANDAARDGKYDPEERANILREGLEVRNLADRLIASVEGK